LGIGQTVTFFAKGRKKVATLPNPINTALNFGYIMPIKITEYASAEDKKGKELDWLCDESWRLPDQLEAFEKWLHKNATLPKGLYAADIAFSPRDDAFGGGGVVSLSSMSIMLSIGMELYLSEYPEGTDE